MLKTQHKRREKRQERRRKTSCTAAEQDSQQSTISRNPEDTLEDLQPQTRTFPLLEDLIDKLLNKLNGDGFSVHYVKNYGTKFRAFESLKILKEKMIKCIPLEVKELQEDEVTHELLEEIFAAQNPVSEWPEAGGYLADATSCNDPR